MRHQTMTLAAAALAGFALWTAPVTAFAGAKSHTRLILKVDSVSAHVTGRKLVVTAKGAVSTGGWQNPQLRALPQRKADTDTLRIEFRASPPPPGVAVIQAILPVSATATFPLPRHATTKVTVKADTNAVTADISAQK